MAPTILPPRCSPEQQHNNSSEVLQLCLLTWSSKYHIEVHPIDANAGVILDSQIYVFLDTIAKVSSVAEVVSAQLIFSHLEVRSGTFSFLKDDNFNF